MKKQYFLLTALACSIANTYASEDEIKFQVLNQNFESDLIDTSKHYNSNVTGWLSTGPGEAGVTAPLENGEFTDSNNNGQVAFLQGGGELSQSMQTVLESDVTYKVTFDLGRPVGSENPKLLAKFISEGLVLGYTQIDTSAIPAGTWQSQTVSFDSSSEMPINKPISIAFLNRDTNPLNTLHIDNVEVSKIGTPELLRLEKTGMGIISEDIVLRVPEDFSYISDALDELHKHFIRADKIATIKVSNCTQQTLTESLFIKHPQGENIHIIGNTQFPEKCQINISSLIGLHVNDGKQLGLIDGFTLNNSYDGGAANIGLYVSQNANVSLGENMVFKGFGNAIRADRNGSIFANGVKFDNNKNDVEALLGGVVQAENTTSTNNQNFGFYAHKAGRIYAQGANVQNLEGTAFYSVSQSYINANNATSSSKNYDFIAQRTSAISAVNTNVLIPEQYSAYAYDLSHINRDGSNAVLTYPEIGSVDYRNSSLK